VCFLPKTIHIKYEMIIDRPHIPNTMRCYRCHQFGTPSRGVLLSVSMATAVRVDVMISCVPTQTTLPCELLRSTFFRRQNSFVSLDEKSFQELRTAKVFPLLMPERSSLKANQRPGLSLLLHLFAFHTVFFPQCRPHFYRNERVTSPQATR
jgi:hypothetical protein